MKIWPWDFGEEPFWTNPENGYEWYVEKDLTNSCTAWRPNNIAPLKAVSFIVVKVEDGKRIPVIRVLIDKDTTEVLHEDTTLEGMACKIDWLRLAKSK